MGAVGEAAGGGEDMTSQPSRESLRSPSTAGAVSVARRVQWTASPTSRLTKLLTMVEGELRATCSPTR